MSVKAMLPALDTHTHILSLLPPLPHLSLLLARARALSLSRSCVCVCARALLQVDTHAPIQDLYLRNNTYLYLRNNTSLAGGHTCSYPRPILTEQYIPILTEQYISCRWTHMLLSKTGAQRIIKQVQHTEI